MRSGEKSDALKCITPSPIKSAVPRVEAAALEGSVSVRMIKQKKNQTFAQYCSDLVYPQLQKCEGGILYGEIRKLAYFLKGIRKNCIYFGGLRKKGILSDTEILNFEGQNTAKFQS